MNQKSVKRITPVVPTTNYHTNTTAHLHSQRLGNVSAQPHGSHYALSSNISPAPGARLDQKSPNPRGYGGPENLQ